MKVLGSYSFKGGEAFVREHHPAELAEVVAAVESIDASQHRTKTSKEKTMPGRMLFNPKTLNLGMATYLHALGWRNKKVKCTYSTAHDSADYTPPPAPAKKRKPSEPFRDMDFVKNKLGVEVQFGKYAFMVYNVCAKMTIFHNLKYIDSGIEVVPLKQFADDMSTGVSYFEQIVWDLQHRGEGNIDIPVLVLGIG